MRHRIGSGLWLALGLSLAVTASPSVAFAKSFMVVPLTGKGGRACSKYISKKLKKQTAVQRWSGKGGANKVKTWKSLQKWMDRQEGKLDVDVLILGTLKNSKLILEAYGASHRKLLGLKKISTRSRCKLSKRGVRVFSAWIKSVIKRDQRMQAIASANTEPKKSPPSVPPPTATPKTGPKSGPKADSKTDPKTDPKSDPKPGAQGAGTKTGTQDKTGPTKVKTPRPKKRKKRRSFWIAADLEVGFSRRSLAYGGAQSANIRGYTIDAMATPALRIDVRPLRWRFLSPLELSFEYRAAVGVESARVDGGPDLATNHAELSARLSYHWLVPGSRFTVVPQVGFHQVSFTLRAPEVGAGEDQVPNVRFSSGLFGLGLHVPVIKRATLVASASYLLVGSAGQLLSDAFFAGSAQGILVQAGLRYELFDQFFLYMRGHYLSYRVSVDAVAGRRRTAESASDTYSGVRGGVRFEF